MKHDTATPEYVDTDDALRSWVARLDNVSPIAVDTESDSFHSYREKVCLIQMTAAGVDVIIDTLAVTDLQPLTPVMQDPNRIKLFHDACYDLACLHRDYGFMVNGLFDTMVASRILGWRKFGLAAILLERYNFQADKRLQRSDWGRRPLSAEQLDYARYDTHFLPRLYDELTQELRQAGRLDWALEDFARLPATCSQFATRREAPDPHGFWRVKGIRALAPMARGRLKALYNSREAIAQRLDRPPFKVLPDPALIDLAKHPPKSIDDLRPRRGLRRAGIDRFGKELLTSLAKAKPVAGEPPPGVNKRRRTGRMLDATARQRYQALREMRRATTERIGIEPEVGLSNAVLEDLARRPPRTLSAIKRRKDLQGWRHPFFCEPIFACLKAVQEEPSPPADGENGTP